MKKRRVPAVVLAVALSGLAVGLTACGSSKSGTPGSDSGQGRGTTAMSAYVNCMGQNGVTMNIPSGGARPGGNRGSHDPNWRPSFQPGQGPSGRVRPSWQRPSGMARGWPGGMFGSVDPTVLQKAQGVCSSLMPSRGAGRRGPGSGDQGGPGGDQGGTGDGGATAAYVNCLKEHGVTDTSNIQSLNTADATIAKAMQTCAALKNN